jgi:hypothetical protein
VETLAGRFQRQITSSPWRPGLTLVTVTVLLPTGGRFDLYRLVQSGGPQRLRTAPGE